MYYIYIIYITITEYASFFLGKKIDLLPHEYLIIQLDTKINNYLQVTLHRNINKSASVN